MKFTIKTFRQIIALLSLTSIVWSGEIWANKRTDALRAQATGLDESLVSVELSSGVEQGGVLSLASGSRNPTYLVVMIPGWPCVIRPKVTGGMVSDINIPGNFLIRARRFLVDTDIATLLVDCRSDSGDECSPSYQSSSQREQDLRKLILEVKRRNPTIESIWMVGTSGGTVTSAYIATSVTDLYSGFIHTSTVVRPANRFWFVMESVDYGRASIPQLFIHHLRDPGKQTPHAGVEEIAKKYSLPLVTVAGSTPVRGAIDEHSFVGREREVMREISRAVKSNQLITKTIP